jgi:hypothetical protein
MVGYLEAVSTMHTRGVAIDEKDYIFTLMVVLGESPQNAFALAYDMSEFKKVIGTEDEDAYLSTKTKDAENMLAQRQIIQLKDWLEEAYRAQVQSASLNLTDYHFSGQETVQILNNLLKTRIDDLESSSVKDVVSLLKALSDQGALEMGDGGFSRHFVQIPSKFNILCPQCNREGYAVEGLDFRCEFCGCIAKWDESQRRYFPNLSHL